MSTQCATNMYACLHHFKERMIVATFSVSKLDWIDSSWKKENRHRRKKKHYSVPWLLLAGWSMFSFVVESECHPGFIHLLCYLFFLGWGWWQITRLHTHAHTSSPSLTQWCILKCCCLGVEMLAGENAGPPQESAAICFKSSIVNNGGGGAGVLGTWWWNRRKMESIM